MWGLWDTMDIPDKYTKNQAENARLLGLEPRLFLKDDIDLLVKRYTDEEDSTFQDRYNALKRPSCKADVAKYLIVYYEGGVFLDNDAELKKAKNLDTFIADLESNENGVWFTETESKTPITLISRGKPYTNIYANYIIASKKGSSVLKDIISLCMSRADELKDINRWADVHVLWCTGPDAVTTILHDNKYESLQIYNKSMSDSVLHHKCDNTWQNNRDIYTVPGGISPSERKNLIMAYKSKMLKIKRI